ncbi:MAG: hypothetical protein M3325_06115 [Actinomycetota bacterium]|nr:hypothetical protein [Actinomycetota bacterium]
MSRGSLGVLTSTTKEAPNRVYRIGFYGRLGVVAGWRVSTFGPWTDES